MLQRRLGGNLRRLRLQRALSQEHFAELLNVHRTYIGALERGERNPSLRVVERLADELQIEPLTLLQEVDESTETTSLRAAATGTGKLPDARSLPARRRPRPRA
ncbi:MAG: helix-turn-helix transcriptional regulator [Ilumatobacteraceae bacterium]